MNDGDSSVLLPDVVKYLDHLPRKHREKVEDFIRLLERQHGILSEPYSRYLGDKIRELRISFGRLEHRVLYALLPGKEILFITAFLKKTPKAPAVMIYRGKLILKAYRQNKTKMS